MRILIDARLFGPENTGNGRYTMNLVEELAKTDRNNEYIVLLRKKYFDELTLPVNWKKVLADFKHYTFEEQFKLPFLISKQKPDIIHFPHLNVPIFYFGKYIVTIHDLIMHKFKGGEATTRPFPVYQIWRLGYHIAFMKAVLGAKSIIVPSKAVKDDVISFYKIKRDKINVVYEGFDSKISNSKKRFSGNPYFVYVGNAYPHKNLSKLIQATNLLNTKSIHVVNLLISSSRNIFTQRLESLISGLNAGKFVKLLGFVPDNELGSLYRDSVGFVFASLSEGFGLTGLEAISSETLLLASDTPVFREVYQNEAIYFNPFSVDSITGVMQKALQMSLEERKRRIIKAKNFAKRYSWAKMAWQTLGIYESSFKKEGSNSLRQGK